MLAADGNERPARRTRPCSRPLRARDRWLFDSWCGALAAADGQSVRPLGNVVGNRFLVGRVSRAPKRPSCQLRRAGARGADVVRRPVVEHASCAGRDRVLVWFRQTPVVPRDSVPGWYNHAGGRWKRRASAPNTPLQPTASRARSVLF